MWCFSQEKRRAMGEELCRLLAADFINEIQHPNCKANPVLVLKKSGKMADVCGLYKPTKGMSE
jgi:hypothetical protein